MCNLHIYSEGIGIHCSAFFWKPVMPSSTESADIHRPEAEALQAALDNLLQPLAQLLVARGMSFAAVEESLKQAYVVAARNAIEKAHPGTQEHRRVSRISTITGINRREVTRLTQLATPEVSHRPSQVTEVFTRWMTDSLYQGADGHPACLKRQGEAPSFESLAQSVTRDVHPRSLLDELCRLGLARLDERRDEVQLAQEAFVPKGDMSGMLSFLGENTGDHLRAAVSNVLAAQSPPHFEQAVFADELSVESLPIVKALVQAHWQRLLAESVSLLEKLIEEDRQAGRPQNQRVRIGLFSYAEATDSSIPPTDAT